MRKSFIVILLTFVGLMVSAQTKFDAVEIGTNFGKVWLPDQNYSFETGVNAKAFIRYQTQKLSYVGIGFYGDYLRGVSIYDTSGITNQRTNLGLDFRFAGRSSSEIAWYSFNYMTDIYAGYSFADKTAKVTYLSNLGSPAYSYQRVFKSDAANFGANIIFFKDNPDLLTGSERFPYSVSAGINMYSRMNASVLSTKKTYVSDSIAVVDTLLTTATAAESYSMIGEVSFGIDPISIPVKGVGRLGTCTFGISPLDIKVSYGYTNNFNFQPGFTLAIGPSIDDYSRAGQIASIKMIYSSVPGVKGIGLMGSVSVIRLYDLIKWREY